ncbi:MAG: CocE/NonD family hydrolase, partial [Ilumatobacteraceae bacterium]
NVYRPDAEGRFPAIVAHGIYGKDVHFADAYAPQWQKLNELHPGLFAGASGGKYVRWETADPEQWVPHGYVLIQVDARGTGQSTGYLDPFSPREIQDYYESIEWAARQPWSTGKVGLLGISYYAISQWLVAALQPPHLAAIIPWEGGSDHYRDWSHHGGIPSNTFCEAWWPRQVLPNQNGNVASAHRDRDTGAATTGVPLAPATLEGNRAAYVEEIARHPLNDAWHAQRSPQLDRIRVPLLSAGNWGGAGLHLRGNIEGWMRSASTRKWLSLHDGTHFESFYLPQYVAMQKRFFDCYLKGLHSGWEDEPPVQLSIRRPGAPSVRRMEREFPLSRTLATRFHLDAAAGTLSLAEPAASATAQFAAAVGRLDFSSPPFAADTEFTGFVSLRLRVCSSTCDADIFATLRALDPEGREVIFQGASEPVPLARGWLRASHRSVDAARSTPFRTFHPHDAVEKLVPGEPCELDLEMWPTSVVFPKGYRLVLTLTGRDLEFEGIPGRILHTRNARDEEFCGRTTIHTGGEHASCLVMPLIPPRGDEG